MSSTLDRVRVRAMSVGGLVAAVALPLLLLTAPWPAGVAVADSRGSGSSGASAEDGADPAATPASPSQRGPTRANRRAVVPARGLAEPKTAAEQAVPDASTAPSALTAARNPAAAAPTDGQAAVVADSRTAMTGVRPGAAMPSGLASLVIAPVAAAARQPVPSEPTVDPVAAIPTVAPAPAAAANSPDQRAATSPRFPLVQSFSVAVERFLDTTLNWLDNQPSSPFTDFLTGALWLARRALFPAGSGVGMGGVARCSAPRWQCKGADLSGADLTGADLTGGSFTIANLTGANLTGANLTETSLFKADLTGANLTGAVLKGAELFGTNLTGADLTGAVLKGAQLSDSTNLTNANLKNANLWGVRMPWGLNLSGANLYRAELGSYLAGANLTGANLSLVRGSGINLTEANLEGAILEFTSLPYANLEGVNLMYANLEGADLRSANLNGADLRYANLEGADLTGASLLNVRYLDTTCPDGSVDSCFG